jgi:cytochrome c oxidase subunit 6b
VGDFTAYRISQSFDVLYRLSSFPALIMSTDSKQEPKQEQKDSPEEEEEEEECGFCRYMKAGGCKQEFTAWSKCVDDNREGGKDFTEECRDATISLQECMLEHKDYYKDFLGEDTSDSGKGKEDKGKDEGAKEDESKETKAESGESKEQEKESNNDADKSEGATSEGASSKAQESEEASDSSSKSGSSKSQTDKLKTSQQDSLAKQARTIEQETNPVKAKPSEGKMAEAQAEPPKPERESDKQTEEGEANEEGEEEEQEEEKAPEIKVETTPNDRRFVTTNQARHCYTRYQEYHRCTAEKGEDSPDCSFFQRAYRSICPSEWVEKWNEQREEGSFAGRY